MNGGLRLRSAVLALICCSLLAPARAAAQAGPAGMEVSPVNIQMDAGQSAAALTITNHNSRKMSFQVRGYAWQQDSAGNDTISPTADLLASPPLATVKPGESQVVRLILRRSPQGRESTYRIIFDQLPAPHDPGTVSILVRLSIPVFAEPNVRTTARLGWRIGRDSGRWWLIATNSGTRHLTVRSMQVATPDGRQLQLEIKSPPHILPGATRRWAIVAGNNLSPNEVVHLTGSADVGVIDQRITLDASP